MKRLFIPKDNELVKCPRCNGTGKESPDLLAAAFTLGFSLIVETLDPDDCEDCHGDGQLLIIRH